jgi:putative transposase
MARLGRYFLPGQPLHVIQRGNNRNAVFFGDEDRRLFLDWLGDAAARHGCAIHAYVLMTNHFHLLVTPSGSHSVAATLQSLGRRYVRHVNASSGRSGTLWEGRYRATLIESERYLLACTRYVELNPVRAGIVADPAAYRWSSCRHNLARVLDPLVTEHALYKALGEDRAMRAAAYAALLAMPLDEGWIETLRHATNHGWAIGDADFMKRCAAAGRRPAKRTPGRKRNAAADQEMLL